MAKIACSLETKELWDKFHELGTEMIITKSGRWGRVGVLVRVRSREEGMEPWVAKGVSRNWVKLNEEASLKKGFFPFGKSCRDRCPGICFLRI